MRTKYVFLCAFALVITACSPTAQTIPSPQPAAPTQAIQGVEINTLAATETVAPSATATETPTLLPTESATPVATIPAYLTSIPGIAATLTAIYATPGAEETLVAQQTMVAATVGVQMTGLSDTLLSQCPNPSDPPLQNWLEIPVMTEATAGQEVQTLIGSYYCYRAPVTVDQMETFYKDKLTAPDWVLQSDTNGEMLFAGFSQKGAQILFLVSGPGNKGDLIIVINPTLPISLPTPQQ